MFECEAYRRKAFPDQFFKKEIHTKKHVGLPRDFLRTPSTRIWK